MLGSFFFTCFVTFTADYVLKKVDAQYRWQELEFNDLHV